MPDIELLEYQTERGTSPFATWFESLDVVTAARVTMALTRLSQGNRSGIKGVGAGVFERCLDFGPGYRVYFGRDGDRWIILLGGGTKRHQQIDIDLARARWLDYQRRKSLAR